MQVEPHWGSAGGSAEERRKSECAKKEAAVAGGLFSPEICQL
jgi:hypothetical protein